ncbi:MAG: sulfatase-like hydrolase/transferase [Planctomycetota bacterium]
MRARIATRRSAAWLIGLLGLALAGCGSGPGPAKPRSALVITLDTTRYDALGCTGGPSQASPNLDALAGEGVLYTHARTVAPLTMPSHATILTGLTPLRHTVHTNSQLTLPESAVTLAERAAERGFQTGAFVAAVVLADSFGLDQGFDVYDQPTPPLVQQTLHYDRRRAAEVADAAIAWIDQLDPERPFLAWAHFFDPHLPYEPPQRFVDQVGEEGYHAEVAAMDFAIGRILDALRDKGLYDETMVVVVADHGEGNGDHGEQTHGTLAFDSTIRVQMIVRYTDGHRAGERSDEIVSATDVYPTLVEALELGAINDVDGMSLFKRAVPPERGVYFESYYGFYSFGWSPVVGWANRDGKYLHSSAPEFYTPREDGGETLNRFDALGDGVGAYRDGIDAVAGRSRLERATTDAAEAAVIAKLQGLGYTGAGSDAIGLPHPLEDTGLPSPLEMQELYRVQLYAQDLNSAGRAAEAVPLYRRVVAGNEGNAAAWFQLGGALIQVEEYEESIEASQRALAVGHSWYGPHRNVGLAYDNLGQPEEALAGYKRALDTAPDMIDLLTRVIALCEQLGDDDQANAFRMQLIQAREKEAAR